VFICDGVLIQFQGLEPAGARSGPGWFGS
jgi:hypothetical protein